MVKNIVIYMKNKKYKICIYAICKNEIKFIDRWYDSVKGVDYVCVLDTGSTDGSFEKLKTLGIICQQKTYSNFRFDVARNDSLKLIPKDTDICICLDMDEILLPGWKETLLKTWKKDTTQARYRYTWSFNPDGSEGIVFMADKIHKYNQFTWKNPVHEILTFNDNSSQCVIELPELKVHHHADNKKSRSNYLPLLELSVKEDPTNDRNMHYLGREYMFHGRYDKAIETLNKHLQLKTALWAEERSASYRYIANCYKMLGDYKNQEKHLLLAILEYSKSREAYFELGVMYFENKEFLKSAFAFNEMLKIIKRELNYMSSPICWSGLSHDYLSMCYYELKDYRKALEQVEIAISFSPTDNRLLSNRKIFIDLFNSSNQ